MPARLNQSLLNTIWDELCSKSPEELRGGIYAALDYAVVYVDPTSNAIEEKLTIIFSYPIKGERSASAEDAFHFCRSNYRWTEGVWELVPERQVFIAHSNPRTELECSSSRR